MSIRLIRRSELQRKVSFSMVHIWRLEKEGKFPKRIVLGGRSVAWNEDEVDAWIEAKIRYAGQAHGVPAGGLSRPKSSRAVNGKFVTGDAA
jgi:prophage regulatory protein